MKALVEVAFKHENGREGTTTLLLNVPDTLKGQRVLTNIDNRIQKLDLVDWVGWALKDLR